ncbi:unnamed protein product [Gordionus sp. m RMFG-2023]
MWKLIRDLCFVITMSLLGVVLNAFIVCVLMYRKNLRTVINLYLTSLCFANLALALCSLIQISLENFGNHRFDLLSLSENQPFWTNDFRNGSTLSRLQWVRDKEVVVVIDSALVGKIAEGRSKNAYHSDDNGRNINKLGGSIFAAVYPNDSLFNRTSYAEESNRSEDVSHPHASKRSDDLYQNLNLASDLEKGLLETWVCKWLLYLIISLVFASNLAMVPLSVERYIAVVYPFVSFRNSCKRRALKIITVFLAIPFLLSIPYLLKAKSTRIIEYHDDNDVLPTIKQDCRMVMTGKMYYDIVIYTLIFGGPLLIKTFTGFGIIRVLDDRRKQILSLEVAENIMDRKKKMRGKISFKREGASSYYKKKDVNSDNSLEGAIGLKSMGNDTENVLKDCNHVNTNDKDTNSQETMGSYDRNPDKSDILKKSSKSQVYGKFYEMTKIPMGNGNDRNFASSLESRRNRAYDKAPSIESDATANETGKNRIKRRHNKFFGFRYSSSSSSSSCRSKNSFSSTISSRISCSSSSNGNKFSTTNNHVFNISPPSPVYETNPSTPIHVKNIQHGKGSRLTLFKVLDIFKPQSSDSAIKSSSLSKVVLPLEGCAKNPNSVDIIISFPPQLAKKNYAAREESAILPLSGSDSPLIASHVDKEFQPEELLSKHLSRSLNPNNYIHGRSTKKNSMTASNNNNRDISPEKTRKRKAQLDKHYLYVKTKVNKRHNKGDRSPSLLPLLHRNSMSLLTDEDNLPINQSVNETESDAFSDLTQLSGISTSPTPEINSNKNFKYSNNKKIAILSPKANNTSDHLNLQPVTVREDDRIICRYNLAVSVSPDKEDYSNMELESTINDISALRRSHGLNKSLRMKKHHAKNTNYKTLLAIISVHILTSVPYCVANILFLYKAIFSDSYSSVSYPSYESCHNLFNTSVVSPVNARGCFETYLDKSYQFYFKDVINGDTYDYKNDDPKLEAAESHTQNSKYLYSSESTVLDSLIRINALIDPLVILITRKSIKRALRQTLHYIWSRLLSISTLLTWPRANKFRTSAKCSLKESTAIELGTNIHNPFSTLIDLVYKRRDESLHIRPKPLHDNRLGRLNYRSTITNYSIINGSLSSSNDSNKNGHYLLKQDAKNRFVL